MPRHKPIKFKVTLEPSLIKQVKEIMTEQAQIMYPMNR